MLIKQYIKNVKRKIKSLTLKQDESTNRSDTSRKFPSDFSQDDIETIMTVQPYTMTSPERIFSLIQAVKYIVQNNIDGDIVECGVWKGGSMLAVARTLMQMRENSRHLYLFDTFDGMTEPTDKDVDYNNLPANILLEKSKKDEFSTMWCYAPFDGVKKVLEDSEYDKTKIHLIKGRVEETIPINAPEKISILRLDTDWYESTKHELIHLFPRLSIGGVIIIDDYGWWKGARLATDEYIQQNNLKILLNRIDDTGRIAIKIS